MSNLQTRIKNLISEKDSLISYIHYKNYQSLEDVNIDFGEGNRIILSAYNSTGKSAVARGLEVLAYYAYPKEYKDHISDDQEECEINVGLRNGVVITRVFSKKYQYYTVKGMGLDLDTRISDDACMIMEGNKPPMLVQKLLNFAIEPETKQKLNIRYAEDGLLFSRTTGSVNYKTFYNALDLPELTQAIRSANDDKNTLNNQIDEERTKRNLLKDKEIRIRVFDADVLNDRLEDLETCDLKLSALEDIQESVKIKEELSVQVPPNVGSIDISVYLALLELSRLVESKTMFEKDIQGLRTVETINITRYKDIDSLLSLINDRSDIAVKVSKTPIVDSVDLSQLKGVTDLNKLYALRKNTERELAKTTYIEMVDVSRLNAISDINKMIDIKYNLESDLEKTNGIEILNSEIIRINELRLDESKLNEILDLLKQKKSIENEISTHNNTLEEINKKVNELSIQIKAEGYVKCPNCNHLFKAEEGCKHGNNIR